MDSAWLQAEIRRIRALDRNQLSEKEYLYIAGQVLERQGCRLLVFGAGNDSGLWDRVNSRGRTVFLEDSAEWIERIRQGSPDLDLRQVTYGTQRSRWKELLAADPQALWMDLPPDVAEEEWDLLFVDGPTSFSWDCPGRMKSIFTASTLAHRLPGTEVFVHDCDRALEHAYCERFFGADQLVGELDRLRHYRSTSGKLSSPHTFTTVSV